jgi:type I restriction enzyme, S subunit
VCAFEEDGVAVVSTVVQQQVPDGYKQTRIGVIPDDWDLKELRSVLKENPKYGIGAEAVPLVGKLPVYIRITDISEDGYFKPSKKVGVDRDDSDQYVLEAGDVVFARTGASVGKSYLYREEDGFLVYAGFLIKISPDPKKLVPSFLFQYVKTRPYWDFVNVMSMRSGQPGINGVEYGQLPVPFPSIKEQTAIANALSDVDALITSLEKLIAKKRAIKTAAMQQLLTGKKRLPPFDKTHIGYKQTELGEIPKDWEVRSIGEFAPFQRGFDLPNRDRVDGVYPVVYSNGIVNFHNQFQVKGPGVVTGRSGTIGKVHYVEENYWPHNTALWVTKFYNAEPKFVYYLYLKIGFSRFSSGSGVPTLNRNDAHSYKLAVPSSKQEQTAIASVLSDMDKEIDSLEQRLNKTQQLKQGMMQELLTGRTRLV